MALVLSLIAGPSGALDETDAARAAAALVTAGAVPGTAEVLAPGRALDLPFAGPVAALDPVRAAFAGRAIDVNAVPAANRRKRLLIADMDSTIIGCECIDEIADAAGLKPQIAAITERAMRGEIAFEPALRERVRLLKGLAVGVLGTVYAERVRLNPGAREAVRTMAASGAHTLLVSGGFTFFAARVAAAAGFADSQANVLHDDGAVLTGAVGEPVLGRAAKREALERALAARGLAPSDALAVGDGANDLEMIRHAGLGVAYRAKPVVAAEAHARLDHADLTGLLYLQGYTAREIVRG